MAVEYQNEIKFQDFFAFTDLDFIASFDHPRGWKFHSINLFFWTLKTTIRNWEQKNEFLLLIKMMCNYLPCQNFYHCNCFLSENQSNKLCFLVLCENSQQISSIFLVNPAARVHFIPFWVKRSAKHVDIALNLSYSWGSTAKYSVETQEKARVCVKSVGQLSSILFLQAFCESCACVSQKSVGQLSSILSLCLCVCALWNCLKPQK